MLILPNAIKEKNYKKGKEKKINKEETTITTSVGSEEKNWRWRTWERVWEAGNKVFKLTKAAVATQVNFFYYERSIQIEILKEKVVIIFKTHKNVIQE